MRNWLGRGSSRPRSCLTWSMFSGLNSYVPWSSSSEGSPGIMRNRTKLKTITKPRVSSACSVLPRMYRRVPTPVPLDPPSRSGSVPWTLAAPETVRPRRRRRRLGSSSAGESDRRVVLGGRDPYDAHPEPARRVALDDGVRARRVDPFDDRLHRDGGIPSLDIAEHHTGRRIPGGDPSLRRRPCLDRGRKLGAPDERFLGFRHVDQRHVARGESVAVSLPGADPPSVRLEQRDGTISVSVGDVEQVVRPCSQRSVARGLCAQEVLDESPDNGGHGETVFGAPRLERAVRSLGQPNGERLMFGTRGNDGHRWCDQLERRGCRVSNSHLQRSGWPPATGSEIEPRSEQEPHDDRPILLGESVERLLDQSSRALALGDRPSHIAMISPDIIAGPAHLPSGDGPMAPVGRPRGPGQPPRAI